MWENANVSGLNNYTCYGLMNAMRIIYIILKSISYVPLIIKCTSSIYKKIKSDQKEQDHLNRRLEKSLGNLPELLLSLHKRISLTVKMVIATVIFGTVMWHSFDLMQTRNLEGIFHEHMNEELRVKAEEDRHGFERYVKRHLLSARLFTLQKSFSGYVDSKEWSTLDSAEVRYHIRKPVWLSGLPEMPMSNASDTAGSLSSIV